MYTTDDALQAAKILFGIEGDCAPLPGEYDSNFHLTSVDGKEFLLKISRHDECKQRVAMQNAMLVQLHSTSYSFSTPIVLPTLAGETWGEWNQSMVRLFQFVPVKLLADFPYQSLALLQSLGEQVGAFSNATQSFQHPAASRFHRWDLKEASWIRHQLAVLKDSHEKEIVSTMLERYEQTVKPLLPTLRHSVIHGDMNDYNILVSGELGCEYVSGFIDFGDMVETATICELAIAVAYAMLNKSDPLTAAATVVRGYHAVFPLNEVEISVLFTLICMRLCVSVVNAAIRKQDNPHNDYLTISEQPAWRLLKQCVAIHPRFAYYTFREACGLTPCDQTERLVAWLSAHTTQFASLFEMDLRTAPHAVFDLSPTSTQAEHFTQTMAAMQQAGAQFMVGQYNEPRLIYSDALYQMDGVEGIEQRTIHLGLDISLPAGEAVHAPWQGIVCGLKDNAGEQDYGPTVTLAHHVPEKNLTFYTLYGHLNRATLSHLKLGQVMQAGDVLGWLGEQTENGGWSPHLHFQVMTDLLDYQHGFPGVARASQRKVWLSLCVDPNLMIGIPNLSSPSSTTNDTILSLRHQHIAKNVKLSYDPPLQIVRGIQQYLYDDVGKQYLDCVNNVCHVGHCHPRVVATAQQQIAILNTNTRYLHPYLGQYAERLLATLPKPLEVCFFVCSGSEANELAVRLAEQYTQRQQWVVMDHAYHGNTKNLIQLSPYKFNGAGGSGKPTHVQVLPMPDLLRRQNLTMTTTIAPNTAAFIAESLLSCGGQVVLPHGYLQSVYQAVRNVGGVCIADEVQVGLGRVGTHGWGFETQGVVPDIVTLGKPLGNGHPIGAVVTTRAIADAFCNGMEYFNTFGGNTVSCAIGLSVLDVLQDEQLQAHARTVGDDLKQQLTALQSRHPVIGEVRGMGLFLGIELVTDRQSLAPATALTAYVIKRMKEKGILLSADGPFQNVIKIKPPMVFTKDNATSLTKHLDDVLSTSVY